MSNVNISFSKVFPRYFWYSPCVQKVRNNSKLLVLKLHGGLGDQLSMYFSAVEMASFSSRKLVLCRWTIDQTHYGSPYGLLALVGQSHPVEVRQNSLNRVAMGIYQFITGFFRVRLAEKLFFRIKLHLDRLFGIVNNVISLKYDVAKQGYIKKELKVLRFRRKVYLDSYFSSFTNYQELDLKAMLPGLAENLEDSLGANYAVAHFRVGDIFDSYTSRGVLSPDYYELCIRRILAIEPRTTIFGLSDDIERAKSLYPKLPIVWIEESDKFDALKVLRLLSNSRFLIAANSGLSYWAGRVGRSTEVVYVPLFPTRQDLFSNSIWKPLDQNWELIRNDFIPQG